MATTTGKPARIAGLELGEILGRGGFATVYRASRVGAGHQAAGLAVKIAHRAVDARIDREVRMLQELGAPIAPAFDSRGIAGDGRPYVAMERLAGPCLASVLAEHPGHAGAREPRTVAPLFRALCHVVAAMHERGVIHCDLKPGNILFRADGSVSLIDFGLAHSMDPSRSPLQVTTGFDVTRSGEWTGTHLYMAPEQWQSRTLGLATDLYALGVIAFELVTGRPPFVGSAVAVRHGHVSGQCPGPSEIAPRSAAVDDVVLRALAKDPAARFGSAVELASAFERAASRVISAPPPRSSPGRSPSVEPALASSAPRLIGLVSVVCDAPMPRIHAAVQIHDGVIAAAEGDHYVLGFPWQPSPAASVRAAAAVGGDLERAGASRCTVHLAELRARHRRDRIRLSGEALRSWSRWRAPADASGVRLTEVAARALAPWETRPVGAVASRSSTWYRLVRDARADAEGAEGLVPGRAEILAQMLTQARSCVADQVPTLVTIEGEVGLGKTRLLQEMARSLGGEHRVVRLEVRPLHESRPGDPCRALLRAALALPDGPVSLEALESAWSALGASPPRASHWAAAMVLGAAGDEADELAAVVRAPGALRQATARALALALRRAAARQPLIIAIDDAHRAEQATLDGIELATMEFLAGEPSAVPLGVWVGVRASLRAQRPRWGDRAARTAHHHLDPLELDDSRVLLGALLQPAEFVPRAVLEHLHARSGGVPLYLVELARAIRASGVIRRWHGRAGYHLAADEVPRVSDLPVDEQLAHSALATLAAPLVPLAQLCAVLGHGITEPMIRGIEAVMSRRSGGSGGSGAWTAGSVMRDGAGESASARPVAFDPGVGLQDPGVGLQRLCRRGLLIAGSDGYAMRQPLLGQAIEKLMSPLRRRELHAAVVAYWRDERTGTPLRLVQRLVHHASRCGETELAATLYLRLAGEAHGLHHHVEAEQHYSAALEYLVEGDDRRMGALAGRGSVRYRLQRLADAIEDLRDARVLAEAMADRAMMARLLLEEATVLDWCHEWADSAVLAERALALADSLAMPELTVRASLARGRSLARQEDHARSIPILERAARDASTLGDHETEVMALLMLGPGLLFVDRLDDAERCFERVIDGCRRVGDEFHLAVGHLNRHILWVKKHDIARVIADLELSVELGRELGNAQFERAATVNLAEILYWHGALDRARTLAERGCQLQDRFLSEHPAPDDHLLIARIACREGDWVAAQRHLAWVESHCQDSELPPSAEVLLSVVRLAIAQLEGTAADSQEWHELERRASACTVYQERVEVMVMAAAVFCHRGDSRRASGWLDRATEHASAIWQGHLDALATSLTAP